MAKVVVIEDSTIARMVSEPEFGVIPCIAGKRDVVLPARTGCGSCAKAQAEKQKQALRDIKTCLATLSPEDRTKLKQLLSADQIKIVSISNTGQALTVTY
jgi:hypothetical protein